MTDLAHKLLLKHKRYYHRLIFQLTYLTKKKERRLQLENDNPSVKFLIIHNCTLNNTPHPLTISSKYTILPLWACTVASMVISRPAGSAVSITSIDMALLKLFQKAAQSQSTNPAAASVVEDDETDIHSHLQELDRTDPTSITENPDKLETTGVSHNTIA